MSSCIKQGSLKGCYICFRYSQIKAIVEGGHSLLIERVAEDVAAAILDCNPLVEGVEVAIRKPHVAIAGNFRFMGAHHFENAGESIDIRSQINMFHKTATSQMSTIHRCRDPSGAVAMKPLKMQPCSVCV